MDNNKTYIYTYLFTLIGGVLLVILHNRAQLFDAISIIVGIAFLTVGLLTMLSSLFISTKQREAGVKRSPGLIIVSFASLILGLLMVIVPSFFVHYLVYAFGIIMILCGVIQLYNFMPGMKSLKFNMLFLAIPVLSIAAGLTVIVMGAAKVLDVMALLTGIVLIIYSINGFTGYFRRIKLSRDVADPNIPVEIR